jgi:hypothetical protein
MQELRDLLATGATFPSRSDAESYLARIESDPDK